MTVKDFLTTHGISTKTRVERSKSNNYEGTDTKITWLKLQQAVEGQDVLVMSATLAAKYLEDKSILQSCQVQHTEHGFGLIMPANVDIVEEIEW